jgi:hypothetical protein
LNSAIRPWCTVVRYSMIRRSLSSAVAGFRMAHLSCERPICGMGCSELQFSDVLHAETVA